MRINKKCCIESKKERKKSIISHHFTLVWLHFSILVFVSLAHLLTQRQKNRIISTTSSFCNLGSPKFRFVFVIVSKSDSTIVLQILFRIVERAFIIHEQQQRHSFVLLVFSNVSKFGCVIYFTIYFYNGTAVAMAMTNTHQWFLLLLWFFLLVAGPSL